MQSRPITANRRRFIVILPLAGVALLAACSKPADTSAPVPSSGSTPPSPPATPTPAPAVATTPSAVATAEMPALDEADPLSKSLGYVNDASRSDTARFANHVAGSNCANCAVYQGAGGSVRGGCPIFAGKSVEAAGWCSAWAKKA